MLAAKSVGGDPWRGRKGGRAGSSMVTAKGGNVCDGGGGDKQAGKEETKARGAPSTRGEPRARRLQRGLEGGRDQA
jgi:hypothetical protein